MPQPGPLPAVATPRSGELVGHQQGAMSRDTEPCLFAGQRMLVLAAVFVAMVLVLRGFVAVLASGVQLLAVLVILAAPVLVIVLIPRLVLGRRMGSAAVHATWRAGRRMSGMLVGAAGAAATPAASSLAGRVRAAMRRGRVIRHLPVMRFQVRPVGGGHVHCLLRGEFRGQEPHDGDVLRLTGRRARSGDFLVQRIEILGTPSGPVLRDLRRRYPRSALSTIWWSRACYATSALAFVWGLAMMVDLTR